MERLDPVFFLRRRLYIFVHTEYDFSQSNIGFEVFRFENDMAVEHWDNIQLRKGQNNSNHSMVDGPTEVKDLDKTEGNRNIVITVSLVSWFVFFWSVQDSGGTATLVPPYLRTSLTLAYS